MSGGARYQSFISRAKIVIVVYRRIRLLAKTYGTVLGEGFCASRETGREVVCLPVQGADRLKHSFAAAAVSVTWCIQSHPVSRQIMHACLNWTARLIIRSNFLLLGHRQSRVAISSLISLFPQSLPPPLRPSYLSHRTSPSHTYCGPTASGLNP